MKKRNNSISWIFVGSITVTVFLLFENSSAFANAEVLFGLANGEKISETYLRNGLVQQTIRGTVTDEETGESIPGVNIYIVELETGAATSVDGDYEISISRPGTYTLVASYVGYERYETEIEIGQESTVTFNIELAQMSIVGEDVVVVGYGV